MNVLNLNRQRESIGEACCVTMFATKQYFLLLNYDYERSILLCVFYSLSAKSVHQNHLILQYNFYNVTYETNIICGVKPTHTNFLFQFMVDVSNAAQLSASTIQLLTTLTDDRLQDVSVLILLNKV